MKVLTVFRQELRHGGVGLLFCSVGLVFKDSGSVPHFSFYVSSCLVPGAAWARCLEQVFPNYGRVRSSGPKDTAGGSWIDSQKDFWSSWLENAWKAASRALAVKHVIEYLVIFASMWKISHICVTVCLDSHLLS